MYYCRGFTAHSSSISLFGQLLLPFLYDAVHHRAREWACTIVEDPLTDRIQLSSAYLAIFCCHSWCHMTTFQCRIPALPSRHATFELASNSLLRRMLKVNTYGACVGRGGMYGCPTFAPGDAQDKISSAHEGRGKLGFAASRMQLHNSLLSPGKCWSAQKTPPASWKTSRYIL